MGVARGVPIALALALTALAAGGARAQSASVEYAVKAAYLPKFAPFVEWPQGALPAANGPMAVCVVGDDPFGGALERAMEGQRPLGRPVAVRRLARVDGRPPCQLLFVAGSKGQSVADALAAVRGAPILTVTDSRTAGDARGIIHFAVDANRVRFHIDDQAAQRAGLGLSSKLLRLALSVRSRS